MPPQVASQIAGVQKVKTIQEMTNEELEKEHEAEKSLGRRAELAKEIAKRRKAVPPPPPSGTGNAGIEVAPERKFEDFSYHTGSYRGGKGVETGPGVARSTATAADVAAPGVMNTKHYKARDAMMAKYNAMSDAQLQNAQLSAADMGEAAIIREILLKRGKR